MSNLDALKSQRATLSAEVNRLGAALGRLDDIKRSVAETETALAAFDAKAADVMLDWATGGEGEPPAVDHLRRTTLLRDLARARAVFASAGVAHGQLTGDQRNANDALAKVSRTIETLALDELEQRHQDVRDEYRRIIEQQALPALKRVLSLHAAILAMAMPRQASGQSEDARLLLTRAERIRASIRDLPGAFDGIEVKRGDVLSDGDHWRAELAKLTGDTFTRAEPVDLDAANERVMHSMRPQLPPPEPKPQFAGGARVEHLGVR